MPKSGHKFASKVIKNYESKIKTESGSAFDCVDFGLLIQPCRLWRR
jgi:hypothetical protein